MENKFYSTTQAAEICRVTPGTIIYWIKQGKLETTFTAGGHRRISDIELTKLVKKMHLPVPKELMSPEPKGSIKILIVDDEANIRQMTQWALKEAFPTVEIEEAEDGLAAGWKVAKFCPDIILLDLMMSRFDGFRFCELVRTNAELKNARVIAMSGVQGFGFEEKILKLGAHDFLAKPFQIEELKEKIMKQLKVIDQRKKGNTHDIKG